MRLTYRVARPEVMDRREVWVLCRGEVARVELAPDGWRRGVGVLIQSYEIVPEA